MDAMQSYYEKAFTANESGNIYQPFSLLERLSHERKTLLLNAMKLPSLAKATVVDYGVGSWGFGCVFPRLKKCRHAIGIDISERAVEISRELSAKDTALRESMVEYRVSSGYSLPLEDESVDVFFAGECIEHIDDTEAFLAEVHRVLKPEGIAIFTTPNARPYVYRQLGLRWCVGFEHTALMDHAELKERLEAFFQIECFLGFNQSMHPALDGALDETTAREWVNAGESDAVNATGLIVSVRKTDKRRHPRADVVPVESADASIASPGTRRVEVAPGYEATLLEANQSLIFTSPPGATRCSLILWSHPWSGNARIEVAQRSTDMSLYSHLGGCFRITLPCNGNERISISALSERDARSQGTEVIVLRAVFACEPAQSAAH